MRLSLLLLCMSGGLVAAAGIKDRGEPLATITSLGAPSFFPLQNSDTYGSSSDLFPMPDCFGFKLEEASIDDMQKAMAAGELTSLQLVTCYLTRNYQTAEYINTILQINPDVFLIAARMDDERKRGIVRSALHGIPFLVKDNIATKDNLETTAGSWALLGSIVPRDAFVVKKLRDAGAVLLGKSTLSEWADMRSNNYSEGYSGRGGQARSSYNLNVNPGGSSTGSGVAVGANVVAFALGTETDGSVINPASRNAIVGIKPTVGLTSRDGVIPESEHQDTVGAFGKTVRDATYALDAIYGIDGRDNYTLAQKSLTPQHGYVPFLAKRSALKHATFGVPWHSFWRYADADQQAFLSDMIKMLKASGATIINNTEITNHQTLVSPDGWNWDYGTTRGFPNESEYTYVKVDFYNNINKYLSELTNTKIKTIDDLVQYNYDNDGSEGGNPWPLGHPAFYSGQDGFLASLATKGKRDAEYYSALEFCQSSTRKGIDDALSYKGNKLDGLLVPPAVAQAPQIAAQAGYPMITVPAGISEDTGMPYGLGIMQTAFAEAELVKWGSAIEDACTGTKFGRTMPGWRHYLERNVPVPF